MDIKKLESEPAMVKRMLDALISTGKHLGYDEHHLKQRTEALTAARDLVDKAEALMPFINTTAISPGERTNMQAHLLAAILAMTHYQEEDAARFNALTPEQLDALTPILRASNFDPPGA